MKSLDKIPTFIDYLFTMTDDVGIFQHSVCGTPDPREGYTTDDNCRALILAVMLYEDFKEQKYLKLVSRYLAFMLNAQNENGKFKNFMNYKREFMEAEGSEDCFGRCLWALGRTVSSPDIPENIKRTCEYLIEKILKHWPNLESPRAKAYSIVGLSYLKCTEEIKKKIDTLAMELVHQYTNFKDEKWHWFENSITYGNSFFPWSLFAAYKILGNEVFLETARESMDFLGEITFKNFFFKPIGCNGWLEKGKEAAKYDEQPIEACETLLANIECFEVTKEEKYLDNAFKCYGWYRGQNSKNLSLIDEQTGACYDGLTETGVNYNQGSESIISYGIAFMEIKLKRQNADTQI
ncbi:MAG: hypothetical protein ACERKZ_11925 [Lachnotalea sp.]